MPSVDVDGLPSTAVTSDGRLHLAVAIDQYSQNPTVGYANLAVAGATWSSIVNVGPGAQPVTSTTGDVVYVYASELREAWHSRIRSYFSVDSGNTWREHPRLGGSTFDYVIDSQGGFDFSAGDGDALFSVEDQVGSVGNLLGEGTLSHRLDLSTKKLGFRFKTAAGGSVVQLKLWMKSTGITEYRIGLRADSAGTPGSSWLNEQWVGGQLVGGAFATFQPPSMGSFTSVSLTIPQTNLVTQTAYHLVVEPTNRLGFVPGPTNWIEVEAIKSFTGAEGDLTVNRELGPSWSAQASQVGHFVVSSATSALANQEIVPSDPVPAWEWAVTGEEFLAPRAMTPSTIRVLLGKVGNPNDSVTLRLLEGSSEIWSQITTASDGWNAVTLSGVSLTAGHRYRLVVDSRLTDPANRWNVSISGNAAASWDGIGSTRIRSPDRPGLTDKSLESSDQWRADDDFVAFNAGGGESVYFGSSSAFDYVSSWRTAIDPGLTIQLTWSYWNGSQWATLTPTQDDLMSNLGKGQTSFQPPADWAETEVSNSRAFWVKATSSSSTATPIHLGGVDSIRDFEQPSVPPQSSGGLPIAYLNGDTQTIENQVLAIIGRDQYSTLAQPQALPKAYTTLPVSVTFTVISAGPVTRPDQVILGDAVRVSGQIQTSRNNSVQTTYRTLQVATVQCTPPFTNGTATSENSVQKGSPGENANPKTITRFIFVPSGPGTVTCTLRGRSESVTPAGEDGNLTALAGAGFTELQVHVSSSGSGQDAIAGTVVPKSNDWTTVATSIATTPTETLTVIGDLELSSCTNSGPDGQCPVHASNDDSVTAESKLTIKYANPAICPASESRQPTTIHTNVHHRKLRNTIVRTLSQLQNCGATLQITLSLRVTAGDADGVEVEFEEPGAPPSPPRFSVLLRTVG